jgi:maleylacetate reductase
VVLPQSPPPQKVVFGAGALAHLPRFVDELGWRRVLLCTTGSARRSGRAGQVEGLLGERLAGTYDRVQPHVPEAQVEEAFRLAHAREVEAVLGLGGGSAIGLAKALSYMLNRLRDADAEAPGPPPVAVAAIPTTYAGSEMTPVFGITAQQDGVTQKVTTTDPRVLPRLVLYDPELTLDLPPGLTASTGINALAHCVEAVYAVNRNALSTAAALAGARAIRHALPRCFADGTDLDARTEMLDGAQMAGKALADVSMGLHHGLCHVLGGSAGVPHGVANAIILPHAMRFNLDATTPRLAALAAAMDLTHAGQSEAAQAQAAIDHVAALTRALRLPQRLREAGDKQADLSSLARLAAASKTVKRNPKPVSVEDAEGILQDAW